MKKHLYISATCLGLFFTLSVASQQGANQITGNPQLAKKYTLMERFEPDLALSASERERLKAERFAEIKLKMQILDTMDISERKREKLLSDLIERPFSTRLSRTMADGQFEEEK